MAHISYLTAFFLTPGKNIIFTNRIYLLIPVLLYAFIILTMLAGAINRMEKVNTPGYWLVLAGAVLSVISDSAIAISRFTWHFNYSGVIIMSTYISAQYLITNRIYKTDKGQNYIKPDEK
jgi:uncharacterized membrane protein YhhN